MITFKHLLTPNRRLIEGQVPDWRWGDCQNFEKGPRKAPPVTFPTSPCPAIWGACVGDLQSSRYTFYRMAVSELTKMAVEVYDIEVGNVYLWYDYISSRTG